jgi:hypothetical protein
MRARTQERGAFGLRREGLQLADVFRIGNSTVDNDRETPRLEQLQTQIRDGIDNAKKLVEQTKSLLTDPASGEQA